MSFQPQRTKIGILGGGQLGRMLAQAASNLDLRTFVLDPDINAPARFLASQFVCGKFTDKETVVAFGKQVEVLTIEIENVDTDALFALEAEGVQIFPKPTTILLGKDKGLQKEFFKRHGLPISPFALVASGKEAAAHPDLFPAVLKLRTGGYDGRGVQKVGSPAEAASSFTEPCVLERQVSIRSELSIVVARSRNGDMQCYPPVEMQFHPTAHLVEFLFTPANISPEIERKARLYATTIAEQAELVGVLAVEMFITTDGELLVNELAPRVHNSGHHTIEGNTTSQFEQHLRAILGVPLGDTAPRSAAIMVNLLGAEGASGPVRYEGLEEALAMPGVYLHLYGKAQTRPHRKMGHITVTDAAFDQARTKAFAIKQLVRVTT